MRAPIPQHPERDWQSFVLQPFPSGDVPSGPITPGPAIPGAGLELTGQIRRRGRVLELRMRLGGDLASVVLAEPSSRPERSDDLWRSTCFELFLAEQAQNVYWEVNLSPAGHWNVYRFSSYRQGMEIEPSLQAMPFEFKPVPGAILLELNWLLPDELGSAPSALGAGVCAVIEQRQGQLSYWALTHQKNQADFHRRDGLVLRL